MVRMRSAVLNNASNRGSLCTPGSAYIVSRPWARSAATVASAVVIVCMGVRPTEVLQATDLCRSALFCRGFRVAGRLHVADHCGEIDLERIQHLLDADGEGFCIRFAGSGRGDVHGLAESVLLRCKHASPPCQEGSLPLALRSGRLQSCPEMV